MRDIEEIEEDLREAEQRFVDEDKEVYFHKMNRDEAKGYFNEYTKELEEARQEESYL